MDTEAAIKAAYLDLSEEDYERIDRMADDLVAKIKARCASVKFSKAQALEMLAMVGICLNGETVMGQERNRRRRQQRRALKCEDGNGKD